MSETTPPAAASPDDAAPPEPAGGVAPEGAAPSPPVPPPKPADRWKALARETATTLLIVLVTYFGVKTLLADVYLVHGSSMERSFHDGERVLISKLTPRFFSLARDDVVVFTWPDRGTSDDGKHVIKRIVGVPGDEIAYEAGQLLVNGEPIDEARAGDRTDRFELKEGFYYVVGDNRHNSKDSRVRGPLSVNDIDGKVVLVLWPPGSIRTE